MKQIAPIASTVPYMQTVGNHEKYYNWTSYMARFYSPNLYLQTYPSVRNFYYSFDYAGIHFISTCTEDYVHPYSPGSVQYNWLVNDLKLANQNRKNNPFIVLLGHRPMYSSDAEAGWHDYQKYIEPLMKEHKVDLGIYGHEHEVCNPLLHFFCFTLFQYTNIV